MNIIFGSIYLALSLFMCIRGIKRGGRQSRLSFYFALWWAMVGISYFILNHYKQKNQPTNKKQTHVRTKINNRCNCNGSVINYMYTGNSSNYTRI